MLFAYRSTGRDLERLDVSADLVNDAEPRADLGAALWIDLYRPLPRQTAAVEALGIAVPSPEDMEEIEISNRLYHEDGASYITVVIPGSDAKGVSVAGPVTFILSADRLVSVRHHAPKPFETFPTRAGRGSAGCAGAGELFLGLAEEIVARLADLLEAAGREIDAAGRTAFAGGGPRDTGQLRGALVAIGQQGELLGRVRLGLTSMERALSFHGASAAGAARTDLIKALMRDLSALSVHADFLSSRVSLIVDTTLGLINLAQNNTVRILSVVSALFLPPTLVASAWGMNLAHLPFDQTPAGSLVVTVLMAASSLGTFLLFKWKDWL
jgi:magnesium transporter